VSAAPAVSVLMPAFDAATFVVDAIDSLLAQSFRDFELIVVDDGSTDATPELLAGFRDPRLVVLTQPENRGYVPALERAISVARGRYLARQDADDLSLPGRLAAQLDHLDRNPEVVLLGTAYCAIDPEGRTLATYPVPEDDGALRWHMLFRNAFVHSAVMLRRAALDGLRYDASFKPAEDYRLWSQLMSRGRGASLPAPLVAHRRHPGQISEREKEVQSAHAERVSRQNLAAIGVEAGDEELRALRRWVLGGPGRPDRLEMAALARTREVLAAFAAATGDRGAAARAGRAWVRGSLGRLPARDLAAAWRAGLLPALLGAAPGTALAALARRPLRRLTGRRTPAPAAPAAARDTR
jgi:hypothetical protein